MSEKGISCKITAVYQNAILTIVGMKIERTARSARGVTKPAKPVREARLPNA